MELDDDDIRDWADALDVSIADIEAVSDEFEAYSDIEYTADELEALMDALSDEYGIDIHDLYEMFYGYEG